MPLVICAVCGERAPERGPCERCGASETTTAASLALHPESRLLGRVEEALAEKARLARAHAAELREETRRQRERAVAMRLHQQARMLALAARTASDPRDRVLLEYALARVQLELDRPAR